MQSHDVMKRTSASVIHGRNGILSVSDHWPTLARYPFRTFRPILRLKAWSQRSHLRSHWAPWEFRGQMDPHILLPRQLSSWHAGFLTVRCICTPVGLGGFVSRPTNGDAGAPSPIGTCCCEPAGP